MADLENQQQPPAAPSPSPAIQEPADYQELRQFRDTYTPALQAIAPFWDDYVKPLLEDESEREFYKTARESRKQYLEQQKPKLTPELELIREEFRAELDPIVEYVRGNKTERENATKAAQEAAQAANVEYGRRLLAERPDLGEDGMWGMHALATLAQRDNISLEDAWKRHGSRFAGPAPKREAPPSMRGAAAAPGVPGPSTEKPIRNARDLTSRLAANLRAGGMKG